MTQWGHLLVMVLHPLFSPMHYLLQVVLHVLRSVAGKLVDNLLTVGLHGFLIDGLEDLTLHIVLQLFSRVAPFSHKEDRDNLVQWLKRWIITQIQRDREPDTVATDEFLEVLIFTAFLRKKKTSLTALAISGTWMAQPHVHSHYPGVENDCDAYDRATFTTSSDSSALVCMQKVLKLVRAWSCSQPCVLAPSHRGWMCLSKQTVSQLQKHRFKFKLLIAAICYVIIQWQNQCSTAG